MKMGQSPGKMDSAEGTDDMQKPPTDMPDPADVKSALSILGLE